MSLKIGEIGFLNKDPELVIACEVVGYRTRPNNAYILKELQTSHNINGHFTDNYWEQKTKTNEQLLSAKDMLNKIKKTASYTKFGTGSFVALAILQTELGFENVNDKKLDSIVLDIGKRVKEVTKRISAKSKAMQQWNDGAIFQTKGKIASKLQKRRENNNNVRGR